MANIKELKKKIKSTKGTLKITQAMKLVSAAKLNKAQQAIQTTRPYATELNETIKAVSALVENYNHQYFNESENKQAIILVISANKGLCGGYNSQLAKHVRKEVAEKTEAGEDIKVVYIGKKVRDLVSKEFNSGQTYEFKGNEPSFIELQTVGQELANLFTTGEVGKVYVCYNVFKSAIEFIPSTKQLLPMSLDEQEKLDLQEKFPFDFKYDPNPKEILDILIPESFSTTLWTCQLDANAAEHGSRMSSMDAAVGNCKEAIRTQTLTMNKLRQAAITTELIEVVSGAESLNA